MAWAPGEGGGGEVPEMGFRAGPFVLCKDGCCHQRRRNTNFGLENFFSRKNFPPHICSQNDERDVGIILSHECWGRDPPPPGTAGRGAPAQTPLPARRPRRGRGGLGKMGFRAIPPPQRNFLPALFPPCPSMAGGLGCICPWGVVSPPYHTPHEAFRSPHDPSMVGTTRVFSARSVVIHSYRIPIGRSYPDTAPPWPGGGGGARL